jgi:hypothetical protein
MFGLFGKSKQEKDLRQDLASSQFEIELPKVMSTFKIAPVRRAGKSARYSQIEAVARFILEEAIAEAQRQGKLKTRDDLSAAAAFSAAVCEYLTRNSGLAGADARELQGFVPAFVFPHAAGSLLRNAGDFKAIVSKGLLRYDLLTQDEKHARIVKRLDTAINQFICQRNLEYLAVLSQSMADLR